MTEPADVAREEEETAAAAAAAEEKGKGKKGAAAVREREGEEEEEESEVGQDSSCFVVERLGRRPLVGPLRLQGSQLHAKRAKGELALARDDDSEERGAG